MNTINWIDATDDLDILKDAGKISHEIACDKALTEFEKYRVKQDKLYKSDFDLLLEETDSKKGDEIMYIWIGIVLEKDDENYIRDICKAENENLNISEQAFTLPQHISLKTSFNASEYVTVIQYLKEELKDINAIELKVCNLTIIDGKVIWLDIEENSFLRELHNKVNLLLKEKFNIWLSGYDGENFKFHSTLFQETVYNENINKIGLVLKEKMKIPFLVNIKELSFGISEVGRVGTYKIIDKIELKNPIDKLINDLKEPMAELNNIQN